MLDEAALLQTLRRHWEYPEEDEDSAHDIYHDDAVLEFPQSGERFEGVQNFREWRRQYPAKLEFHLRRINHRDDLVVTEYTISHNGTPWLFTVSIMEFEDDRVAHERIYVTEGWEPADWRAPWRAEQPAGPAPPWLSEPPQTQKSWYKHPLGIAGITVAILILLSLIGSVFEPEKTSSNAQKKPDDSAEKTGGTGVMGTYAAQVEKKVGDNFAGGRIQSRCDIIDLTWHCFFDSTNPRRPAVSTSIWLSPTPSPPPRRAGTPRTPGSTPSTWPAPRSRAWTQWPRSTTACTQGRLTARMFHT